MTTIMTIVHCWNPPGNDQYAQHLRFLLASRIHYPPTKCKSYLYICHAGDPATMSVMHEFKEVLIGDNCSTAWCYAAPEQLFRRAILRHRLSYETFCDIVHFADVDYFYGPGCLDSIAEVMDRSSGLCIPSHYWICRDHLTGDDIVEEARFEAALPKAELSLFNRKQQKVAIGGLQFVGGDLARRVGYFCGERRMRPVDAARGFRSCRCDKWWRQYNKLKATRVGIENLYRLRHSSDGRDFDETGKFLGREAWS